MDRRLALAPASPVLIVALVLVGACNGEVAGPSHCEAAGGQCVLGGAACTNPGTQSCNPDRRGSTSSRPGTTTARSGALQHNESSRKRCHLCARDGDLERPEDLVAVGPHGDDERARGLVADGKARVLDVSRDLAHESRLVGASGVGLVHEAYGLDLRVRGRSERTASDACGQRASRPPDDERAHGAETTSPDGGWSTCARRPGMMNGR